jgi:hypothetical protein
MSQKTLTLLKNNFKLQPIYSNINKTHFNYISKKNFLFRTKQKLNDTQEILLNLNEGTKISFYSKVQVCKDGFVLRFLFPDSESIVGFKTCQYIYLEANHPKFDKPLKRPYHPVSLDTDKGFIDIMIKVYPKEENGSSIYGAFSNYLAELEVIF